MQNRTDLNFVEVTSYPKDLNKLCCFLAEEGHKLLAREKKIEPKAKTQPPEVLETKLGSTSTNPIVRARVQVLNKMTTSKRNAIEKMEKTGDINNSTYNEFVKKVSQVADEL